MTTSIQSSQQKYRHFGFTDDPSLTDALEQLRRLDGERSHAAVLRKIVRNGVAARLAAAANSPRRIQLSECLPASEMDPSTTQDQPRSVTDGLQPL